jgi:hypothetical protein
VISLQGRDVLAATDKLYSQQHVNIFLATIGKYISHLMFSPNLFSIQNSQPPQPFLSLSVVVGWKTDSPLQKIRLKRKETLNFITTLDFPLEKNSEERVITAQGEVKKL